MLASKPTAKRQAAWRVLMVRRLEGMERLPAAEAAGDRKFGLYTRHDDRTKVAMDGAAAKAALGQMAVFWWAKRVRIAHFGRGSGAWAPANRCRWAADLGQRCGRPTPSTASQYRIRSGGSHPLTGTGRSRWVVTGSQSRLGQCGGASWSRSGLRTAGYRESCGLPCRPPDCNRRCV